MYTGVHLRNIKLSLSFHISFIGS